MNDRQTRHSATRALAAALALAAAAGAQDATRQEPADGGAKATPAATLDDTRTVLDKWIETQRILAKERKDWQQGKEVLEARLELLKHEVAALEQKIGELRESGTKADAKKRALQADEAVLQATLGQLAAEVTAMEAEVKKLFPALPEPLQEKVRQLHERIPADAAATKVTAAERFQNVLGILQEVDKANGEITVAYEVRALADGKPSEVKTIYVGLGQAFYVSAGGGSGIGRPGPAGWQWEPAKTVGKDVLQALEILQGKHSPAFVPLPVSIR